MLKIKACWKNVENMLENCWLGKLLENYFITILYYFTILVMRRDLYSYRIVCSSGLIAIVGKVGSSGSMAAVAERSPWPQ